MIGELERISKEAVVAYLRQYLDILLEGARKTTKDLSLDSRCKRQGESKALPLRQPSAVASPRGMTQQNAYFFMRLMAQVGRAAQHSGPPT
jgi:hypothetical protein